MKKIIIVIFLILLGIKMFSQNTYTPIITAVPFLTIAPDSRAGAMGDVGVATSSDIYSQHWNPSKFAFIDGNGGIGISYVPQLRNITSDINILYLTGYKRLDSKQVLSASLTYSSLGSQELRDEFGNFQQNFTPTEFAIDMTYSRLLSNHFSSGISFRFIYSNLSQEYGETVGTAFSADISGYYQNKINLFNRDGQLGLGLNFSNLGSKINYSNPGESSFIPMNMKLGTSLSLNLDKYNKIGIALDVNKLLVPILDSAISVPAAIVKSFDNSLKVNFQEIMYSAGLEYWYNNTFAIRGGYHYENPIMGNRQYFTAGIGFKIKAYAFDFSYLMPATQTNPLANTIRFSVAWNFNSKK